MKRRTANILLAIGGVLLLCVIAVVGLGIWLFRSAVNTEASNEATASRAFEEVRGRFSAVGPVLEIRDRELVLLRKAPDAAPAHRIQTIHVLTWNPDEGNLTRITVPMWVLRMSDDPIDLSTDPRSGVSIRNGISIRPEDIERYGPTLLVDHQDEDGERVLVWSD